LSNQENYKDSYHIDPSNFTSKIVKKHFGRYLNSGETWEFILIVNTDKMLL